MKCWFLRRGENRSSRRKNSRSRVENQQTQPTYDTGSGNRTRDTLVEGERSHHYTKPVMVEVMVISLSLRLRLITLTKTLIILDITKSEPTRNNNFVLLYIEQKKLKSCFCFFTDGKQHKACKLDMITLRNQAQRSYMT